MRKNEFWKKLPINRLLAICQVLGSLLLLVVVFKSVGTGTRGWSLITWLAIFCASSLSLFGIFAGYLLWKDKAAGYLYSKILWAMQIMQGSIGGLGLNFCLGYRLAVVMLGLSDGRLTLTFDAHVLSTGFYFSSGYPMHTAFTVGVNGVALIVYLFLSRAEQRRRVSA